MITGNTDADEPFRTQGGAEKRQRFLDAEAIGFRKAHRHDGRIENINIQMKPQSVRMSQQQKCLVGQIFRAGFSEKPAIEVMDL